MSLKLIYLLNLCFDSNQTSTAVPEGQPKGFSYSDDLDPIFKVTSQLTKFDIIAKMICLEPMEGYSSDVSGYIVVTDLRHVKFWVTLTPFTRL